MLGWCWHNQLLGILCNHSDLILLLARSHDWCKYLIANFIYSLLFNEGIAFQGTTSFGRVSQSGAIYSESSPRMLVERPNFKLVISKIREQVSCLAYCMNKDHRELYDQKVFIFWAVLHSLNLHQILLVLCVHI